MTTILALAIISTNIAVFKMSDFDYCFNKLISNRYEGDEYTDTEGDRGGKTKWGITQFTAVRNGYLGDMRDLPKEVAKDIYYKEYWKPLRCDEMPTKIAFEVFETGVHAGLYRSVEILQKAINIYLLSHQIMVDGHLGMITMTSLKYVIETYGESKLKLWFNIFQGVLYYDITRRDETQRKFLVGGWTNRLEFK